MLKRGISSLVVFSFLWMDIAPLWAMEGEKPSSPRPLRLSGSIIDSFDPSSPFFPIPSSKTLPPKVNSHSPSSSETDSTGSTTASPEKISSKASSSEPSPRRGDDISLSSPRHTLEQDASSDHTFNVFDTGTLTHQNGDDPSDAEDDITLPQQSTVKDESSESDESENDDALSRSFRDLNPTEMQRLSATRPSAQTATTTGSSQPDDSEISNALDDLQCLLGENPPRKKGRGEKFEIRAVDIRPSSSAAHRRKTQSIKKLLSLTPQEIALLVSQSQVSSHHLLDSFPADDDITQQTALLSASINSYAYGTGDPERGSIPSKHAFFIERLAALINQDNAATLFEAWIGQYSNQTFESWITELVTQNKNLFGERLSAFNETSFSSDLTVGEWWQGYLNSSDQPLLSEYKSIIALSFSKYLLTKEFENEDGTDPNPSRLAAFLSAMNPEGEPLSWKKIALGILGTTVAIGMSIAQGTIFNFGIGEFLTTSDERPH